MPQSKEALRKKGIGKPPPPPPQRKYGWLRVRGGPPKAFLDFLERLLEIMRIRESRAVALDGKYLNELIDVKYVKGGRLDMCVVKFLYRKRIRVWYDGHIVKFRRITG